MATEKSKILIIGGTGYIGKFVVEASAKAGHSTFILVREITTLDPVKGQLIESFKNLGVTLVYGDLYDHECLVKAIKQVDVVISTVGKMQIPDQTKIIAAIKEAGNVKRFLPSEFGMDVDHQNAIEPACSTFAVKVQIRRTIEAEGIPFTYVACNCFAGAFLTTLAQPGAATSPPRDKVTIFGDGAPKEMAQAESTALASSFKSMFDREKLTGSANFNDWYRQLRIVLRVAKRLNYLTTPCPPEPAADATAEARAAWQSEYDKYNEVACIMLGSMNSSLQKQFENYFPNLMLEELQRLFEKPVTVELYDLIDALHSCKQGEGKPVSAHCLEMMSYMDQLGRLNYVYPNDIQIGLINRSLNKEFDGFVRNYNMHCTGKTVSEVHAMLIDYEKGLPKKASTPAVLTIQKGRISKPNKPLANKKGKGKGKADKGKQVMTYQQEPKKYPPKKRENPKRDQACHHCTEVGHWKRNCPLYLDELRNKRYKNTGTVASTSGT